MNKINVFVENTYEEYVCINPEILDEKCGSVVECDDYESFKSKIIAFFNNNFS